MRFSEERKQKVLKRDKIKKERKRHKHARSSRERKIRRKGHARGTKKGEREGSWREEGVPRHQKRERSMRK